MSEEIRLNGQPAVLAATVAELVQRLNLPKDARGIAVAVNGAVVPRGTWGEARLAAGDVVEIIRAISGG